MVRFFGSKSGETGAIREWIRTGLRAADFVTFQSLAPRIAFSLALTCTHFQLLLALSPSLSSLAGFLGEVEPPAAPFELLETALHERKGSAQAFRNLSEAILAPKQPRETQDRQ